MREMGIIVAAVVVFGALVWLFIEATESRRCRNDAKEVFLRCVDTSTGSPEKCAEMYTFFRDQCEG